MGQEILYCGVCQEQLRSSDFEKHAATKVGREAYCKGCIPAALKSLPPDKAQALQAAASTVRLPLPPPEQTPKRASQRIPLVDTPRTPRRAAPAASSSAALWAALAGGAAVLALAGALLSGNGAPPPAKPSPKPPEIVVEPAPTPPAGPTVQEQKALAALQAARASGLEADFEKALAESRGTPLEADARKGLDELHAARAKRVEAEVAAALAAEDFGRASQLAPSRAAEFLGRAGALFPALRDAALKASKEEVAKARARIAKWGVGSFAADFDQALADAAKPAPPPPPPPLPPPADPAPSAEAVKAARDAALERAGGRQFAEALAELAKLKATEDLELLQAVAAVHADAWQGLGKSAKGRKIAVISMDYDFRIGRAEGTFLRLHDHAVELLRGKSTVTIPQGQVMPRSFADWVPAKDRRAVAAACLLEGDEAGALDLLKDDRAALPARWWDWAIDFRRRHTGEAASAERGLSYKYYDYAMNFPNPATRAEGGLAMSQLAREHRGVAWVARHLPLLESRTEFAKEYVAGADVLRPGGAMRLETDRDKAYWTCAADGDPLRRRETCVEMDFSTLPDVPYRAWAYVGACCAETAAFALQGSELAAADDAPPFKHGFLAGTKTHASHGGKKHPSRWSWVELALPKYAAAGAKTLRLATNQQGFSVAWILVSATREKPFSDVELKERDRELPRGPGPLGPTLGLLAWFRADAGAVSDAGRVGRWLDQSGRQRHAVQPDPAARPWLVLNGLNNRPSIRFDGTLSSFSLEGPVNGLGAMTLVALAQPAKNLAGFELGKGALFQWKESGPWGGVFLSPQQRGVAWRFGTAAWGNQPIWWRPNNEVSTAPLLVSVRKDGPREDLFVQGNAVLQLSDRKHPTAHCQDLAGIGLGSDDPRNPPVYWAGDLGELLIYSRALPDAERLAVEGYLRLKYGF